MAVKSCRISQNSPNFENFLFIALPGCRDGVVESEDPRVNVNMRHSEESPQLTEDVQHSDAAVLPAVTASVLTNKQGVLLR